MKHYLNSLISLGFLVFATQSHGANGEPSPVATPSLSPDPSSSPTPEPEGRAWVAPPVRPTVKGDEILPAERASPIRTGLHDLRWIGEMKSVEGAQYFLVSGRPCADSGCAEGIYGFSSDPKQKPVNFTYPGQITDTRSSKMVFNGRAFYGRCLPRQVPTQDVFVLFQDERIDRRGHLQPSVFVAKPGSPFWSEQLLATRASRLPQIKDALRAVKSKICHEIAGRSRTSIRRPSRIKLPPGLDPDEPLGK